MKRAYNTTEVLAKKWTVLDWEKTWSDAFGFPSTNSLWFVSGPSAAGKSSFVMQLAKELCRYGRVLYLSYEESVSRSFQRRLQYLHMSEVKGRFRVATDDSFEDLSERLSRRHSARFVIIDSYQQSGFTFAEVVKLRNRFKTKGFVYVSMEYKGEPMGKGAVRLRYLADVKVKVRGYRAYCTGRAIGEAGASYVIWTDGVIQTTNDLEEHE